MLVLVNLTLQLSLLLLGSRRRYSVKTWIRIIIWFSYLGADSVATIALGAFPIIKEILVMAMIANYKMSSQHSGHHFYCCILADKTQLHLTQYKTMNYG